MTDNRGLTPGEPVAIDDQDPSNSDIDKLVAPLEPGDDVFTLVNPDQGDQLETMPVGKDPE